MNTIKTFKVPGGRVTISEAAPGGLTRMQWRAKQARERAHFDRTHAHRLVCNGGGRFHGDPVNAFTTQAYGANSRYGRAV